MNEPAIPMRPLAAGYPRWTTRIDGAGGEYAEVMLAADPARFAEIAEALRAAVGGRWTAQVQDPDATYWDLCAEGGTIVVHREHFSGVSAHAAGLSRALSGDAALLRRVYALLAAARP